MTPQDQKKDEALRLALEALKSATPKYTKQRKDQKTLGGSLDYWKLEQHQRMKAITAIKEVLAQPEKDLWSGATIDERWYITRKPEQPAPVEQEPVAWANPHDLQNFDMKVRTNGGPLHTVPLYTSPPQPKKPEQGFPKLGCVNHDCDKCKAPQRPSRSDIKPLTDQHCKWQQSDDVNMPDTWEASCGAIWTFTEGGPKDNDMHYCPKCGKPAIEKAAHGITEE